MLTHERHPPCPCVTLLFHTQIVADSTKADFANAYPQREVCCTSIELDPKFSYVVVPHTLQKGHEGNFTLRTFSTSEVSIPHAHTQPMRASASHGLAPLVRHTS